MKYLNLFSFAFILAPAFSQSSISGKVVSENKQPLANASVFLPNSTTGVYTNDKGEFTLTHLPPGNINFAVSYIGYETITVPIPPISRNKEYLVVMHPLNNVLQAVIISTYDKGGWKKWGDVFTTAFIGSSSYAHNCIITNEDDIRFVYSDATKQLRAFSDKPLRIENKDLGFEISVSLVDFLYDTLTGVVDYQTYSFFKEMQGTDNEIIIWKKNRLKVYALSLLRFMRSLYSQNFKNEGYQIRLIERKNNIEKQRIQKLYKQTFDRITDSLNRNKSKLNDVNSLIERSLQRDSLKYYQKILSQNDGTEKIHKPVLNIDDIARQKDSSTVILDCKDYMQVMYTRSKEPEEYFTYRNIKVQPDNLTDGVNTNQNVSRSNPVTELNLRQGIPVEIHENGYFTNVDLFIDGFWGWWEKMATKLPYEYEP